MALLTPYVSEFEYSPEFHPSRNPGCPKRWARGVWEEPRSPEEGGPVGQEPSVEIRAVLVRCPKSHEEMAEGPTNGNPCNITAGRSHDILEFHGFDRDEPAHHSEVKNCRRKLIVTMKFNNIGKTRTQEEFVVVDHVLDPVTMRKARLLNPFVFKVRQEQVLQLYGLKFQSVVNGEAKEEVINKKSSNYTGCDDSSVNPTCGQMMYDGQPVPYSQGFCCSCDPDVNSARQPSDRSISLALGTSQKIIPDSTAKQSPSYESAMFASLVANPKTSNEEKENSWKQNRKIGSDYDEENYLERSKNRESSSKRERSLKSSHGQSGSEVHDGDSIVRHKPSTRGKKYGSVESFDGDIASGNKINRIRFNGDNLGVKDAVEVALAEHANTGGRIKVDVDAARQVPPRKKNYRASIAGKNAGRFRNIHEDVKNGIFKDPGQISHRNFRARRPSNEKYHDGVPRVRNADLTAEIIELEKEYEALKNSRKKVEYEGSPPTRRSGNSQSFRDHSKCKDFRKMLRGRGEHPSVDGENDGADLSHSPSTVRSNFKEDVQDERKRSQLTSGETLLKTEIAQKLRKNSLINETGLADDSAARNDTGLTLYSNTSVATPSSSSSTIASLDTVSNSSVGSGPSITTISSNNTVSISRDSGATSYPPLILRQEMVNDKLYPLSVRADTATNELSSGDTRRLSLSSARHIKEDRATKSASGYSSFSNTSALQDPGGNVLRGTIKLKGSLTDQYADWVIKYAKMHNNRYIKSQLEEPPETCDLGVDSNLSSEDSLSHIADKVLREVEAAEIDSDLHREGVEAELLPRTVEQSLYKPKIGGNLESLRSSELDSIVAKENGNQGALINYEKLDTDFNSRRTWDQTTTQSTNFTTSPEEILGKGKVDLFRSDEFTGSTSSGYQPINDLGKIDLQAEKVSSENSGNSSKTWQEILSSKIENSNEMKSSGKLSEKSYHETLTPTTKSGLRIERAKIARENYDLKAIEPAAVILGGTGDMVKGDLRYLEQLATVIADHHSENPISATERDYIFLNAHGREQRLDSLEKQDLTLLRNLREYLRADASNNSRIRSMGKDVEKALIGKRRTRDEPTNKMFQRLDDLVRDSLRSRRRSFRSISYDDPFYRGNYEKQAKIDRQIEKEFTEITQALNESSDSRKNSANLSAFRQIDSTTNRIPKVNVLKLESKDVGNASIRNEHRDELVGRKKLSSNPRKTVSAPSDRPRLRHAHANVVTRRRLGKSSGTRDKIMHNNPRIKSNSIRIESPKSAKAQGTAEMNFKNGRRFADVEKLSRTPEKLVERSKNSRLHDRSNGESLRSSSQQHTRTTDRNGLVESRTNINEIVKQIIRNDYQKSPSWVDRQGHSGRRKNIAGLHMNNESTTQPASIFSLKSVLHRLHIGKLQKKCHEAKTPLLYDEKKDGALTLPPEESTTRVATTAYAEPNTSGANNSEIGSENVMINGENTISTTVNSTSNEHGAEEHLPPAIPSTLGQTKMETIASTKSSQTTKVSSNRLAEDHSGTTSQETLDTEAMDVSDDLSTDKPARKETSSAEAISEHKITGSKMNPKIQVHDERDLGKKYSEFSLPTLNEHAVIQRSLTSLEGELLDDFEPTTWIQPTKDQVGDEDVGTTNGDVRSPNFDKQKMEAENIQLKKELEEIRKTCIERKFNDPEVNDYPEATTFIPDEESTKRSTDDNGGVTIFYELSSTKEDEEGTEQVMTVYEATTGTQEEITNSNEDATSNEHLTRSFVETGTPLQRTTNTQTEERHETTKPATPASEMTTEPKQSSPQTPKGFIQILEEQETPKTRKSSILLVKTYSVSQNPKEFLDNYEFPVGIKKVLLKKLNVTEHVRDPVNLETEESFTQRSNADEIHEEGDTDNAETGYSNLHTLKTIPAEFKQSRFEPNEKTDVRRSKTGFSKTRSFVIPNVARIRIDGQNSAESRRRQITNAGDSFSAKNRRTIHEPNIEDIKLQQFQQDAQFQNNVQFSDQAKRERDLDFMLNGLEDNPDEREFVEDSHLGISRSFTNVNTLPPDDETTHLTRNDDVNATNLLSNYVMEQPIFVHQNNERMRDSVDSIKDRTHGINSNWKYKRGATFPGQGFDRSDNRDIELFYDYEVDTNTNEDHGKRKRSDEASVEKNYDVPLKAERSYRVKRHRNRALKTHEDSLRKREVKGFSKDLVDVLNSVILRRHGTCAAKTVKADKVPEVIPENNDIMPDEKWQGKMDILKMKKHQDILKEYLNWNPHIDTTVVGIFPEYSTQKMHPTTSCNSDEHPSPKDSSTMSILLMEEAPQAQPPNAENNSEEIQKNGAGDTLGDREILDKLSKMPMDENLVIISVKEKNKPNDTETLDLLGEETREADSSSHDTGDLEGLVSKNHPPSRIASSEANGATRQKSYAKREIRGSWNRRNGRRLLFTDHLDEEKRNRLQRYESVSEAKGESPTKGEAVEENEDLVSRDEPAGCKDNSYKKHKRDKLKLKWNQLVDKVIVNSDKNNNNNDAEKRSSNKQSEEVPSATGRTAMEKLHFFDANKYISSMAKKISRLSNVDNTPQELDADKQLKASNGSIQPTRLNEIAGVAKSVGHGNQKLRAEDDDDDDEDDESREYEPGDEDGVWDAENDYNLKSGDEVSNDSIGFQSPTISENMPTDYDQGVPYTSRLVNKSPAGLDPVFGKLGSDFEVSISGKIHINGGFADQPMSISIEGVSLDNVTSTGNKIHGNSLSLSPFAMPEEKVSLESSKNCKDAEHLYFNKVDLGHILQDSVPTDDNDKVRKFFAEASTGPLSSRTEIQAKGNFLGPEKTHDNRIGTSNMGIMSPRKTIYNVVVRARPRYDKWPVHNVRDFREAANDSPEHLGDDDEDVDNDRVRNVADLTAEEPVFDFEKLELHHRKTPKHDGLIDETPTSVDEPSVNEEAGEEFMDSDVMGVKRDNHFHRRQAQQFRQERAMRRSLPGTTQKLTLEESAEDNESDTPDIKLVKLIPVELSKSEDQPVMENEQRVSSEESYSGGKPADFITSELPRMDFEPSAGTVPKRTKIKPVRHMPDNLHKDSMGASIFDRNEDSDSNSDAESILDDSDGSPRQSNKLQEVGETKETVATKKNPVRSQHQRTSLDLLKPSPNKASRNSSPTTLEKTLDTRYSENLKNRMNRMNKAYKTVSPKYVSKISEPFTKELATLATDNSNSTDVHGAPVALPRVLKLTTNYEPIRKDSSKRVRPTTDDLKLPSDRTESENHDLSQVPMHRVKISSPGESPQHFPEQDQENPKTATFETSNSLQDARKEIQLTNLMRMMNFIKKVEDLLPPADDEAEVLDDQPNPESVVEVQSVLVIPEKSSENQINLSDGILELLPTTSERIVEIGEGVKHNAVEFHHGKKTYPNVIILEDPNGRNSIAKLTDKDKQKSFLSRSGTSASDSTLKFSKTDSAVDAVENNDPEIQKKESQVNNPSALKTFLENAQDEMSESLADLEGKSKVLKLSPVEKGLQTSKQTQEHSADVVNLMLRDRLENNDRISSQKASTNDEETGIDSTGQKELPEIILTPLDVSQAMSKLSNDGLGELLQLVKEETLSDGKMINTERPADFDRKERRVVETARQDRQQLRSARTPVADTNSVSKMGISGSKRARKNVNKLLAKRKSKKRKHKKKKKKKKKKKWWPFKRSLLTIVDQDEASDSDTSAHRRSAKNKLKRASDPRRKRQIKAGGAQVRGGQDCMDRRHPAHVNSVKYQESAHCLRFSDLWYSVYELETPILEHTVYLQLYEKHTLPDGSTHWDDLTQGSMVRLGTFVRHQRDSAPTISFTYSGAKTAPETRAHNLDPMKDRLLIPSPVPLRKVARYPEVKGGSGEYLVVQSNAINKEGNECDKAGVAFPTFAKQPNRCGRPKGSCLKNQPLAYWRHDVEAREAGRPGCYFLSNFASVPNNPIKYNVSGSGSREYLGLEYHSPHVSAIDVEVRADYNAIVRVGSSGRVTEVHVDSTATDHTVLTIVVSNMGLASSPYQSRISDCPTGLPVSWCKAKGAMQVIAPQHDQRITLDLYGQLYVNDFHCSVEVVNHRGELVAMRRIRIKKMDRCFCVWHCLCACVGSLAGLECQPMSPEHYHAAGFQGPVPVATMERSVVANEIKDVMMFSALTVLVLLALGMLKWFVGIFVSTVSRWGLDVLLAGNHMAGYFEAELRCRRVVRDEEGKVVHPDTGERSVRICSRRSEFFLNLIFFLTYPMAVCCNCTRSLCTGRQRTCCQDESKVCLLKDQSSSSPTLICVNTYGDGRNSKLEAEDTRYVMNELKRSRDSLQDVGNRCKTSGSTSCSSPTNCRQKDNPVGELDVPAATSYSLRGYFMNGGYRFITPCPFKQHWLVNNVAKKPLKPPRIYASNQFTRTFLNADEVCASQEISLKPKGVCINVQFLNLE